MQTQKWYYLKEQAEEHNVRFLRCNGVLYEVTKTHYPTGPSPLWAINEVQYIDIPESSELAQEEFPLAGY